MNTSLEYALKAIKESRNIEFKSDFNPSNNGDWCEILKDIFAIVNTGGGIIIFGVNNDGTPSQKNLSQLATLDQALIIDKIFSYTGVYYSGFELLNNKKNGYPIVLFSFRKSEKYLIPIRPGTYEKSPGKQHCAFSVGVVYYRHGPKSSPATSDDLEKIIAKRLLEIRKEWFANVKSIVTAPAGSVVQMVSKNVMVTQNEKAEEIRITNNPTAPEYQLVDPDKTHPYRAQEFLQKLNSKISDSGVKLSLYDIKAILKVHGIDNSVSHTYKSKHGPRIYSDTLLEWLSNNIHKERYFAKLARSKYHRLYSKPRKSRKNFVITDDEEAT